MSKEPNNLKYMKTKYFSSYDILFSLFVFSQTQLSSAVSTFRDIFKMREEKSSSHEAIKLVEDCIRQFMCC